VRPGGVVLCTVPNLHHPLRWLEWLIGSLARGPVVRMTDRRWPRLYGYLTYLHISRQRHFPRWWHAAAVQGGLHKARHQARFPKRGPLRLLTLQRILEKD
jgi:hypothetical protein